MVGRKKTSGCGWRNPVFILCLSLLLVCSSLLPPLHRSLATRAIISVAAQFLSKGRAIRLVIFRLALAHHAKSSKQSDCQLWSSLVVPWRQLTASMVRTWIDLSPWAVILAKTIMLSDVEMRSFPTKTWILPLAFSLESSLAAMSCSKGGGKWNPLIFSWGHR